MKVYEKENVLSEKSYISEYFDILPTTKARGFTGLRDK